MINPFQDKVCTDLGIPKPGLLSLPTKQNSIKKGRKMKHTASRNIFGIVSTETLQDEGEF